MVLLMGKLGLIAEKMKAKTATVIIGGWITDGTKASRPKTFRREGGQSCLEQTILELRRGPSWNICILQTFRYPSNSNSRTLIQQANGLLSGYHRDLQHQVTEQTPDQATQRVHRDLQG
jgi:hypothetical protein